MNATIRIKLGPTFGSMMHYSAATFAFCLLISTPTSAETTTIEVEAGSDAFEVLENEIQTYPADQFVKEMMADILRLDLISPEQFELRAGNVKFAAAITSNKKRYVVYNPDFIKNMLEACGDMSAVYYLLAHEIGHHYAGHNFDNGDRDQRHEEERQADLFAGRRLARLNRDSGITIDIEAAKCALESFAPEQATEDHPRRTDRLAALAAGFAGDNTPIQPKWQDGQVFRDCDAFCPEMVVIPAGEFEIGGVHGDPEVMAMEKPAQKVTFKKFALARTELTKREFERFAQETDFQPKETCEAPDESGSWDDDRDRSLVMHRYDSSNGRDPASIPITCISQWDALEYIDWLNSKVEGEPFRLPSESELEYATRASQRTFFPWGNSLDGACDYGNGPDATLLRSMPERTLPEHLECSDGAAGLTTVADYPPNEFKLFDTGSNVSEFTSDCYQDGLIGLPLDGSPRVIEDCIYYVVKGGSWAMNSPRYMRTSFRRRVAGSTPRIDVGIRIARDLESD